MKKEKLKIISSERINEEIVSVWMEAPFAEDAHAGQFVSFYTDDEAHLLPRPISICDINRRLSALRFVFRIAGYGTGELSHKKTGDIVNALGPLGNGFPLDIAKGRRLILCGGGIGIPPMLSCIRDLYDEPCAGEGERSIPSSVIAVLGYRSDTFMLDDFKNEVATYYSTEDGSSGTPGFVTDAINEIKTPYDLIFACGPKMMIKAVADLAKEKNAECYVSLEEHMACGIGVCLGCVTKTKTNDEHYHVPYKTICKNGPVFRADDIL